MIDSISSYCLNICKSFYEVAAQKWSVFLKVNIVLSVVYFQFNCAWTLPAAKMAELAWFKSYEQEVGTIQETFLSKDSGAKVEMAVKRDLSLLFP